MVSWYCSEQVDVIILTRAGGAIVRKAYYNSSSFQQGIAVQNVILVRVLVCLLSSLESQGWGGGGKGVGGILTHSLLNRPP